jgi:hypothetical protein
MMQVNKQSKEKKGQKKHTNVTIDRTSKIDIMYCKTKHLLEID